MPSAPPPDMLRRPFEEPTFADEEVDVVGEGDDDLSDDSDLFDPEDRKPRRSRYDCGFIFEHLWRVRKKSGSAKIWIPETIVFKNNCPTHWYFTRPLDGRMMKRNLGQEQFITPKKILEVMGGATGEIAAVFINYRDVDGKRVATTTQYFDRTSLRDFLYFNDSDRNGILQKFLSIKQQKYAPSASTNQILHTLHVTWKKGDLRSTKVVDRSHSLRIVEPYSSHDVNRKDDDRRPYQYGIADPLQYGQMALPSQSQLCRRILDACERVAEHVRIVSDNAVRMTRMMCFVKVGHRGQLWFNYPSSVDVEDSGIDHTFDLWSTNKERRGLGMSYETLQTTGSTPHRIVNTANVEETSTPGAGTGHRDGASSSAYTAAIKTIQMSDQFVKRTSELFTHCAFCAERIEAMRSCSMTLQETLLFLTRQGVSKQSPKTKPDSSQEPRTPDERASQMWSDMRLTESDEITLPELRWKMKKLQIPPEKLAQIETGIALADSEIRGVVNFHLWRLGIANAADSLPSAPKSAGTAGTSFSRLTSTSAGGIFTPRGAGSPSSPTYLSGKLQSPDSKEELLQLIMNGSQDMGSLIHAAAAGGTTNHNSMEPLIMMNLRSALAPKVLMRVTAPSALERESSEFLCKNVEVCANCHGSVKLFLARRTEYLDQQLERLLAPVASTSGSQATSYRSPRICRPKQQLIDRMWSRSMEMAGKFPMLKVVGYTDAKVMRASENDLAWSHRSKGAGASPRSPPGKKPIRESPRARAVRGFQEMNISEESSLLVRTSSAVKLLHEISDDELMRELGRRERLSHTAQENSDQISRDPSPPHSVPRNGETEETLWMDSSSTINQQSVEGSFRDAREPMQRKAEEPTEFVQPLEDKGNEDTLQKEQIAQGAEPIQRKAAEPPKFVQPVENQWKEDNLQQERTALHKREEICHTHNILERHDRNQKKKEAEEAKANFLVVQGCNMSGLALHPEPARENMRASATVIQNALRCRRARVKVASMRQRHERLIEQQGMMEVLANVSEQNDRLQDTTTSVATKAKPKTSQLANRQSQKARMSASPNATRGSSPQRLRHQGSQRNDDHSSASPIGRKARISPTAVKSREEYSACARELRARTLGDYRNEEPQQQQEQGGGKPQAEHPPAGHRTAGQGERRQTQATKKAEHAVIDQVYQDLGLDSPDSD